MNFRIVVSRFSICASALISGFLLSACGSKPEASDISKHVESVFRCSPFTVAEVKKTNGAPAGDNQYAVAYSFQVKVKGGEQGAIELVTNLLKNRVAYKQAQDQPYAQREASKKEITQLLAQMHELSRGGCQEAEIDLINIEVPSLIERMQEGVLKAIEINPNAVKIPYVVMFQGTATMLKTEAGWVFLGNNARPQLVDALETQPIKLERPVAPAMPVAATIESPSAANVASESVNPTPVQLQESSTVPSSGGPSFDCAKASTAVEKLICANPPIAAMDRDVANVYREMLQKSNNKNYEKERQATWRSTERDACTDAACLTDKYRMRLVEIQKTLGK